MAMVFPAFRNMNIRQKAAGFEKESGTKMKIILENVTKTYKGKTAVCNINTEFTSGQLIGLTGKNGAGKTTLIKMPASIIKPERGRILFDTTEWTDRLSKRFHQPEGRFPRRRRQ